MANTNYEPGVQNLPFGNLNTNPEGANYVNDSGYSPDVTNRIAKEVQKRIFDAAPAQFNSLKLAFSKGFKDKNLDEFEYLEHSFGRSPLEGNAISAAVVAVPGNDVSQAITLTAASITHIGLDAVIIYPDGTKAVVVGILGLVVTVNSQTSVGLPAVAVGDIFAVQSTTNADGRDHFNDYSRLETITRYNYIQRFYKVRRWDSWEMQKYKNAGTTDYLEVDKKQSMKQLRVDIFNTFWNGTRGEFQLEDNAIAKTTGGIYPTMIAAGSAVGSTTLAGLEATFKALAFNTNFKSEGATRFVYGTDERLHDFARIFKLSQVRYETKTMSINLNLQMIELGSSKYVLVPCELWREESCFTADWQNRLIILDQDTIQPVKLKGVPAFWSGQTDNQQKGTREDFIDWWVQGQFGLEFNNPLASFIIDII